MPETPQWAYGTDFSHRPRGFADSDWNRAGVDQKRALKPRHKFKGVIRRQAKVAAAATAASAAQHASGRLFWANSPRKRSEKWANCGPRRKLNESLVRQIRSAYANGEGTFKLLAERFDMSSASIGQVVHRDTWKHIK